MNTPNLKKWDRPRTAWAVANRSRSIVDFGRNIRDWLHELRALTTRTRLASSFQRRPPQVKFGGRNRDVANAFLAAQVAYLALEARISPPAWVNDPVFVLRDPWFSVADPIVRADLLVLAPAPFKNRNLFTIPEGKISAKPGRPRLSSDHKREINRQRQIRWRARKRVEA